MEDPSPWALKALSASGQDARPPSPPPSASNPAWVLGHPAPPRHSGTVQTTSDSENTVAWCSQEPGEPCGQGLGDPQGCCHPSRSPRVEPSQPLTHGGSASRMWFSAHGWTPLCRLCPGAQTAGLCSVSLPPTRHPSVRGPCVVVWDTCVSRMKHPGERRFSTPSWCEGVAVLRTDLGARKGALSEGCGFQLCRGTQIMHAGLVFCFNS